jgi:hypothetical protein
LALTLARARTCLLSCYQHSLHVWHSRQLCSWHSHTRFCMWRGSFRPRLPLVPISVATKFSRARLTITLVHELAPARASRNVSTALHKAAAQWAVVLRAFACARLHMVQILPSTRAVGPHLNKTCSWRWNGTLVLELAPLCASLRASTTLHTCTCCAAHVGRDHSVCTHVCAFAGGADLAGHAFIGPHLRRNEIFSCALE